MKPDECKRAVFDAARVAFPRFEEGEMVSSKVGKLENHAMLAARWRARLEEARLYMEEAVHVLTLQWEQMEGWEVLLTRRGRDMTQADVTAAKRKTNPGLFTGISDGKHLIRLLSIGIRRLEKDEERGSRVYTFLTGNG